MLILKPGFPISGSQLASLFNSEVMNWLFFKVFNTHKILRGDLEVLPVYTEWFNGDDFDEEIFLKQHNIEQINGTYRIKG